MSRPAPGRVVFGVVARSRGLRGEMVLDRAVERSYQPGLSLQIGAASWLLESLKPYQGRSLLKVTGIDTVEAAEAQRGLEVSVARPDVPLEPGEFLLQDLVGCDLIDEATGHIYGTVSDWESVGPQTLLEVDTDGGAPLLVPLVPAICIAILPQERLIRVKLPEGLADLNNPASPA